MVTVAHLGGMHEFQRLAAQPIRAIGSRLRKLLLNLVIDLLFDIAARQIGRQHLLIVLNPFGAGLPRRQIGKLCRRGNRRRWRGGSDWLRLVAAGKQQHGSAEAERLCQSTHGHPSDFMRIRS